MVERGLPRTLQVALRKYFRYFWSRRAASTDEDVIISNISSSLRISLLRFMHRDIIEQVRVFEVCHDPGFFDIIVQAMRPLCCTPRDVIICESHHAVEMFFLLAGRVEVLRAGTRPADQPLKICEIGPGEFFGEIGLLEHTHQLPGLKPNRRSATVIALTWCELQTIDRDTMLMACETFPEVRSHFEEVIASRIEELRNVELVGHTPPSYEGSTDTTLNAPIETTLPIKLRASIATLQKLKRWQGSCSTEGLGGMPSSSGGRQVGDAQRPALPSAAGVNLTL